MPLVRVMAAGDSITMGSGAGSWNGSYRRPLNDLAPNLQFVGSQCDWNNDPNFPGVGMHEGYSGATTPTVRSNALANAPIYLPSLVLFMVGTNDVTSNIEDADVLYDAAEDILNLASVDHVIVGNIPHRKTTDIKYAQNETYRAAIAARFAALPSGLHFCDPGAVIDDSKLADNLHPNTAGYEAMAPVWFSKIQEIGIQVQQDNVDRRVSLWF